MTVNSRLRNGLTLQIGSSTGRAVTDNCEVVAQVPEVLNPALTNPSPFTANTGTMFEQNYGDGTSFLRPTQILNPRFVRFNVTMDF